ncbi:MAG TPA: NmrA family NAD(P)-binding protein [Candidatus Acidoferrales bacterium]|nr:NmrA family NAD(P)-binding protein [Candidatus Acidoferrales bacterium]
MIVIVGATGHTGRPAAEALLGGVEKVRVIGRDPKRLEALTQKGAEAFVGNVEDVASMTKAFEGATAVYLVLPEDVSQQDLRAHQERVSDCYAAAVASARVPYVVSLSSIGAQHAEKTGPIVGLHNQEEKLNRIAGLNVLHLRAAYFMENLLMSIPPLRSMGTLPGGLTSDMAMPWIATKDIGGYAGTRLAARDFSGSSTQELHGQRDISMKEAASIVGKAIGKPNLGYMQVPFMLLEPALAQMGLPKKTAALLIEMWKGANAGLIVPQEQRSAKNTTPTAIESFVTEVFAPAYLGKGTGA